MCSGITYENRNLDLKTDRLTSDDNVKREKKKEQKDCKGGSNKICSRQEEGCYEETE